MKKLFVLVMAALVLASFSGIAEAKGNARLRVAVNYFASVYNDTAELMEMPKIPEDGFEKTPGEDVDNYQMKLTPYSLVNILTPAGRKMMVNVIVAGINDGTTECMDAIIGSMICALPAADPDYILGTLNNAAQALDLFGPFPKSKPLHFETDHTKVVLISQGNKIFLSIEPK